MHWVQWSVVGGLLLAGTAFAADPLYVESAQAPLVSAPQMSAGTIASLKRGDSLELIAPDAVTPTEGWIHVRAGGKTGWVSSILVGANKPVANADLTAEDERKAAFKAQRSRIVSKTATMGARGLTQGNRARDGKDAHESDPAAVKKLDAIPVDPAQVNSFKKEGQ